MKIVESILTNSPCYKAGGKIKPKGLMLHSVGCPQPSGPVFVRNFATYSGACVHAFIDANDGTVYQTLPWNHLAWHGGGSSNNTHIGVEMCEPDCIKYTSGAMFTCSNVTRAREMADRTYKAAVELFAMLCKEFKLDPLADGVIVSHAEGYRRGIASGHGDPDHLWRQLGMEYTMNTFRQDVKAALGEAPTVEEVKPVYTLEQFISDVQAACGAAVDGIAGPETLSKTVTISATKNAAHRAVKPVQKRLAVLGYTEVGNADGIAGPKFTAAVERYQREHSCYADGEITKQNVTWQELLGMRK